jgi:predicted nucleotidyltransferase
MQNENVHLFNDCARIVSSICSKNRAVQAAYIFGSLAKRPGCKPADIDVAILVEDESASSFPLLSFITQLEKTLGLPADVVMLNRAGEVLKYEIRKSGKLVFERFPQVRKNFEIQGRKTYEDFLYLHQRYVKSVLYGGENG